MQNIPVILGEAIAVPNKEHRFVIKQPAVEGKQYLFRCPECGTYGVQEASKADVLLHWKCPKCNVRVYFKAQPPAPVVADDHTTSAEKVPNVEPTIKKEEPVEEKSVEDTLTHNFSTAKEPHPAVLTWGRFLSRNKYVLIPGEHFIGRKDPVKNSSVMINDPYASARSVSIEVRPAGDNLSGFLYKLIVHKAFNPVYHNNKEIAVGNSVYLEYGDIIVLGQTKFTFNKGK